MTILNNKPSGSNLGKRSTRTPTTTSTLDSKLVKKREKKQVQQQQQLSIRNPFKDIDALPIPNRQTMSDAITMSTSSSTTTVSIEAPRGCLRFCLSHHQPSNSSKNPVSSRARSLAKTPKSAPVRRPSKVKFVSENAAMPRLLQNPEKPTARLGQKCKKTPPYLYPWQSGRKASEKSSSKIKKREPATADSRTMNDSSLGSEHKNEQQQSAPGSINSAGGTSKFRWGFNRNVDHAANITPATKTASLCSLDGGNSINYKALKSGERRNTSRSPTPPVQASISPEIQSVSSPPSVVLKTPVCYAAGHALLGVSDKRKCRPRGLLAVGDDESVGFNRPKVRENCDNGDGQLGVHDRRDSVSPVPVEASMHWLISPQNEKRDGSTEYDGRNWSKLCPDTKSSKTFVFSSPSSHGFSSELGDKSNSTVTSDNTVGTHDSQSRFFEFAPGPTAESQGFFGPSFDHLVLDCSQVSPTSTPPCELAISPEERKYRYKFSEETTPYSSKSYRNENVFQTPLTNMSTDELVIMSPLNEDDMSKLAHGADSVTDLLSRVHLSPEIQMSTVELPSIDVNCSITPDHSVDLTQFHKALDGHASWASESTTENITGSDVRISWREGIVSRIFEMDDSDCCRCISDEEEDVNDYELNLSKSCLSSECLLEADKASTDVCEPSEDATDEQKRNNIQVTYFLPMETNNCAESITTDSNCLLASDDSDWAACYKNDLFQSNSRRRERWQKIQKTVASY